MKDISIFELVFLLAFAGILLLAVAFLSSYGGGNKSELDAIGKFEIVGVLDKEIVLEALYLSEEFSLEELRDIEYEEQSIEVLRNNFTETLASNVGPDLIIAPHGFILEQDKKGRITTIPYASVPLSTYQNKYVQAADIFLNSKGSIAVPFIIDPLVMYYNKNIQVTEKVTTIPVMWDELLGLTRVIKRDGFSIDSALIGLGGSKNIPNKFDILSLLWLQAIGDITADKNGSVVSLLNREKNLPKAVKAVEFYSNFSDSHSEIYTWNESLPQPFYMFLQNKLFLYIGYASQYADILRGNPNLSFGIAQVPQTSGQDAPLTYAKLYASAIPISATYPNVSFRVAQTLGSESFKKTSLSFGDIPIAQKPLVLPADRPAYEGVIYDAAFTARSWKNNSPEKIEEIVSGVIDSVILGNRANITSLLSGAARNIDTALQ